MLGLIEEQTVQGGSERLRGVRALPPMGDTYQGPFARLLLGVPLPLKMRLFFPFG